MNLLRAIFYPTTALDPLEKQVETGRHNNVGRSSAGGHTVSTAVDSNRHRDSFEQIVGKLNLGGEIGFFAGG